MHVVVMLNSGSSLTGTEIDDALDTEARVQETIQKLIESEGQGSFVIETDEGWCCVPTRSIDYLLVVKADA